MFGYEHGMHGRDIAKLNPIDPMILRIGCMINNFVMGEPVVRSLPMQQLKVVDVKLRCHIKLLTS